MKQININIDALNKNIRKLEALKTKCSGIDSKPKKVAGAGTIVDVLRQIDETHAGLVQDFEILLDNTVQFLNNVSQSISEADSQIADELTK